ncbi:MAG: regulatory protein RecX [Fermentimonas sp.]|jgi:regulatory protein|nr:regulatory protein RecX [Fermentimonas sp.]MDD4009415.1 regulatory protein RecX [Fermentimonas sp.]MDD4696361.1 regulatory protein RecX [Fermentimonas sp.]
MSKQGKVISERQAFTRMARLCSQKEYCSFDISQKLYRLNLNANEIESVVNLLVKQNFISDERFVRSYIGDKVKFNKWGKRKIELALRQKKIPQSIIQKVFNEYSDSELNQSLEYVIEKKWRSVKGASDNERKGKLIRYALGRGFEMNEIISSMQKLNLDFLDED